MAAPNTAPSVSVDDFELYVGGTRLPDTVKSAVTWVRVRQELNVPAMFEFGFDTVDFKNGDWRGLDLKLFRPGAVVKVYMGDKKPVLLVVGEITALEPVFDSPASMTVRGYDRLYRFFFGRQTRTFLDVRDSDAVTRIARELGLRTRVTATSARHPYLLQHDQTNYEFVLACAARNDYEVSVEDLDFIFRKSQEGASARRTLAYGTDVRRFEARLKVLTEGSRVQVRGWDQRKKKAITGEAVRADPQLRMGGRETGFQLSTRAFRASPVTTMDELAASPAEARTVAQAEYDLSLNEFIEGEGTCNGTPDLRAGINVTLDGLGERFTGRYYVTGTTHAFNLADGYTTAFSVRRTGI